MRNLLGVSLRRTSKVRKARDPETERKAEEKRARKAETMRRNRDLGAFASYREPRGVPTQAAWPGGRERRESEMARIAARAEQERVGYPADPTPVAAESMVVALPDGPALG